MCDADVTLSKEQHLRTSKRCKMYSKNRITPDSKIQRSGMKDKCRATYVRLWKHLFSSIRYIKKESFRCVLNNAVQLHQATKILWVATPTHGFAVPIRQLDESFCFTP